MRKTIIGLTILLCAVTLYSAESGSPGPGGGNDREKAFVGGIWDSACARTANHASMASVVGADPKNPAQCTRMCVEAGAKYVLLVDSSKHVAYELDDQVKPKEFAGKKVRITGRLKGEILHLSTIEGIQ